MQNCKTVKLKDRVELIEQSIDRMSFDLIFALLLLDGLLEELKNNESVKLDVVKLKDRAEAKLYDMQKPFIDKKE